MGWRGKDGTQHLRGEPNPKQWEMYAQNDCVFQYHMPETMHFMRNWNREYLDFAKEKGWRQKNDPVQLALYSDTLQSFPPRRAGQDEGPPAARRIAQAHRDLLRSAAVLVPAARRRATDLAAYPLNAITQRPMAMYHSWDSQNAWLRQIHSHNYLQVNPLTRAWPASLTAAGAGSRASGGRCAAWSASARRSSRGRCGPGTRSARPMAPWQLAPAADEARKGFLLNHLSSEELRRSAAAAQTGGAPISNSDPITGQAGWYEVRVRGYGPAAGLGRGGRVRAAGAGGGGARAAALSSLGYARRRRGPDATAPKRRDDPLLKVLIATHAASTGQTAPVAEPSLRARENEAPAALVVAAARPSRSAPKRRRSRGSSRSSSTPTSASAAMPA
jgi:hypothetical protein